MNDNDEGTTVDEDYPLNKVITIELEVRDGETFADVLQLLELQLGYMADNVIVRSHDGGI